jgi:hypothetical protein
VRTYAARAVAALSLSIIAFAGVAKSQSAAPAYSPPKEFTLVLELVDLPGRDDPKSKWEVSYEFRIADGDEFSEWASGRMDPAKRANVGLLLSKQSFTRGSLNSADGRRFSTSIPVTGNLLERLSNGGHRGQAIWLDATVRVRDAKLGKDFVERVNPAWRWPRFSSGSFRVALEVSPEGLWSWKIVRPGGEAPQGTKTVTLPAKP